MSTILCQKDYTLTIGACDCSVSWFPSVGPCRLRIVGYFDGLVSNCAAGLPSGAPAWDGTFSRWDPPPSNVFGTYVADIVPPPTSMAGKILHAATIVTDGVVCHLAIDGDNAGAQANTWIGANSSTCPIGVYTFAVGCAAGLPATITVEGYVP